MLRAGLGARDRSITTYRPRPGVSCTWPLVCWYVRMCPSFKGVGATAAVTAGARAGAKADGVPRIWALVYHLGGLFAARGTSRDCWPAECSPSVGTAPRVPTGNAALRGFPMVADQRRSRCFPLEILHGNSVFRDSTDNGLQVSGLVMLHALGGGERRTGWRRRQG